MISSSLIHSLVHTWDSKSTETNSEDQEGNGNRFCVRVSHHQQEGGLHSKTWNIRVNLSKTNRRREDTNHNFILCLNNQWSLVKQKCVVFDLRNKMCLFTSKRSLGQLGLVELRIYVSLSECDCSLGVDYTKAKIEMCFCVSVCKMLFQYHPQLTGIWLHFTLFRDRYVEFTSRFWGFFK